ncbi:GNAT family N-acetyltransferase [Maridesulfovibrio sp.]|uniref:GNAT family N-acetyltransferase n=1 Tax=Maridesulfovibrio sp. TaxID=2795000 RepID=UPI0029F4846B|nr:GNAT family N-acetyltransferase [Maridesulfovibrio sp.]
MAENKIIRCTLEDHAQPILEILNEAILNSTALYDYKARPFESMLHWFRVKTENNLPVIGIENENGDLLGFGSYGSFRGWPAYKYTVEHSVYVHKDFRCQGLGSTLLKELIAEAEKNGMHSIIGGIDAENAGSIALHKKLGFEYVGTLNQVGFKFGRWLNLAFFQLLLETPSNPCDG